MALLGVIIVVLVVAGTAGLAAHVYESAKRDGLLPLPKVARTTKDSTKVPRGKVARAQAVRGGRTVHVIAAEAVATNWLAKKAHQRKQAATAAKGARSAPAAQSQPSKQKRPLLARFVNLRVSQPAAQAAAAAPAQSPAPKTAATQPAPAQAASAPASNGQRPAAAQSPAPTAPGGPSPMTAPAPAGGAAADFFSALYRVTAQAQAGGMRHKITAHLTMGEGFSHQATALEQHARALRETGQYPAAVWEPVLQAAGMLRAAAGKMTESGNMVATIAKTPSGELGQMAPHRDEMARQ